MCKSRATLDRIDSKKQRRFCVLETNQVSGGVESKRLRRLLAKRRGRHLNHGSIVGREVIESRLCFADLIQRASLACKMPSLFTPGLPFLTRAEMRAFEHLLIT